VVEEGRSTNKVTNHFVKQSDNGLDKHWENFVSVVKSRKMEDLHCPIQAGAHVAHRGTNGPISFSQRQKIGME